MFDYVRIVYDTYAKVVWKLTGNRNDFKFKKFSTVSPYIITEKRIVDEAYVWSLIRYSLHTFWSSRVLLLSYVINLLHVLWEFYIHIMPIYKRRTNKTLSLHFVHIQWKRWKKAKVLCQSTLVVRKERIQASTKMLNLIHWAVEGLLNVGYC